VQPPPSRGRSIARTRHAAVPPAAAAERAESSDSACSSNVSTHNERPERLPQVEQLIGPNQPRLFFRTVSSSGFP
jgi:hypothetical protein